MTRHDPSPPAVDDAVPSIDTPPVELSGLVKRFGPVVALDEVDLRLEPGELLAVVGPSGCGKSTLLRTMAGLVVPDSGRVTLAGTVVEDGRIRIPPEGRRVGLVFQDHALFPHLTVRDNVGFGVRDGAGAELRSRVSEMLELVGLPDHGDRYPHELSGGERQRVALARALAPRPALMLFDEPFASIDHNLRVRLRNDVVDALRATGTPAVFVTHDQAEALALGDRIAVMRRGRIVQLDTPATVFHQPVDQFVGGFMGEASFLSIHHDDGRARTMLGALDPADLEDRAANGRELVAMVRPDDLVFTGNGTGGGESRGENRSDGSGPDQQQDRPEGLGRGPVPSAGCSEAAVVAGEYRGSGWLLTVNLEDGSQVLVSGSHLEHPKPGSRGRVHLVPGHRQVPVVADR